MLHTRSQGYRPSGSREDFKRGFTIYGHGGHLGHMTRIIWEHFCSPILRSLHMKFEFNWPIGFRGGVWKCWRTGDEVIGILIAHLRAFGSGELKQQTRFNWLCSWKLIESATIITLSTNLMGIWFQSEPNIPKGGNMKQEGQEALNRSPEFCLKLTYRLPSPCWHYGQCHFWPQGHNLNKLGSGPLGGATYQISRP